MQNIAGQAERSVEVAVFVGHVTFSNGERGSYIGVESVGAAVDPGAFKGDAIILLEDGSVSNQVFEGRTERTDGPGRYAGTGVWGTKSGTGRFAGLEASGRFKWTMSGEEYEDEFSA